MPQIQKYNKPKLISYCQVDNMSALVQTMTWCPTGAKPLHEPIMVHFTDICITWPQWVKETAELSVIWDTIRLMWRHCNIIWKKDGNHTLRIHCIYRATTNLHNAILQYCPNLLNSGFFKSYLDIFTISLHNTTGRHFTAVEENVSNLCKNINIYSHQSHDPSMHYSITRIQCRWRFPHSITGSANHKASINRWYHTPWWQSCR